MNSHKCGSCAKLYNPPKGENIFLCSSCAFKSVGKLLKDNKELIERIVKKTLRERIDNV